jgi:hypothetical protein
VITTKELNRSGAASWLGSITNRSLQSYSKNLVAMLDRDFFQSKSVTREAKLEFITELIKWLENQRKHLGS